MNPVQPAGNLMIILTIMVLFLLSYTVMLTTCFTLWTFSLLVLVFPPKMPLLIPSNYSSFQNGNSFVSEDCQEKMCSGATPGM